MPIKSRDLNILLCLLVLLGLILQISSIPGVFIVDENNYLVTVTSLQSGQLSVPGTEGISKSTELLFFHPGAEGVSNIEGDITSNVPPLYSFIALPFSYFGWPGLVFLNVLSFIICALILFNYSKKFTSHPYSPWMVVGIFCFAGFTFEYAQGLWPHCLSAMLCMAGFFYASKSRYSDVVMYPVLSGVLLGLAAGVRYQNIVFAFGVFLGIVLFAQKKIIKGLYFGGGISLPLIASSILNHSRLGSWNPVSKHADYLEMSIINKAADGNINAFSDAFQSFMSKVVDYSFQPMPVGFQPNPESQVGAIFCMGVLKKALLQSAPWIIVVLAGLAVIFFSRKSWKDQSSKTIELLSMSLIIGGIILLFTIAGTRRIDGLSFNQRYFFDLVPLCAICFACFTEEYIFTKSIKNIIYACLGAITAFVMIQTIFYLRPTLVIRHLALLKIPIIMASMLAVSWLTVRYNGRSKYLFVYLVTFCLSWSATTHIKRDLKGSRYLRKAQMTRCGIVSQTLTPEPTAIFGYWGYSINLGPLLLYHPDLVIADPWIDKGQTAPQLVEDFLSQKRRVLIVLNEFKPETFKAMTSGRKTRRLQCDPKIGVIEVMPTEKDSI